MQALSNALFACSIVASCLEPRQGLKMLHVNRVLKGKSFLVCMPTHHQHSLSPCQACRAHVLRCMQAQLGGKTGPLPYLSLPRTVSH